MSNQQRFEVAIEASKEFLDNIDVDEGPFASWLSVIDRIVLENRGFSIFDLVDQPWRDWYDAGEDAFDISQDIIDHPRKYMF